MTSITYDEMLNPLNLNNAIMTYTRGNMLSTYTKNNITSSYFYNHEGIRTKKVVGNVTHHYLLDEHRIVREYIVNGNNTNELIYLYGISGIIGFIYNLTLYLYEKDIFNNINKIYQISNNNKTLVAKYNYDAYGNTTVLDSNGSIDTNSNSIGNINPFRYRSYYFDSESGYYYLNHRYYVPFICRFLTMDNLSYLDSSSINGINLFAYCKNNPVMYEDPEGEFLGLLFLMATLFNATGSFIFGSIEQVITNGWNASNWDLSRLLSVYFDKFITNQSIITGVATALLTGNIIFGIIACIGMNQLTNAFYYNHFANANSSIEDNSYIYGYLTRWQRLDYTKTQYGSDSYYDLNKMRFYGEYSAHMYGYYVFRGIPFFERSLRKADVYAYSFDGRFGGLIDIFAIIFGLLGF